MEEALGAGVKDTLEDGVRGSVGDTIGGADRGEAVVGVGEGEGVGVGEEAAVAAADGEGVGEGGEETVYGAGVGSGEGGTGVDVDNAAGAESEAEGVGLLSPTEQSDSERVHPLSSSPHWKNSIVTASSRQSCPLT